MKNSRPRIKFSQIPHSIARRIETLSSRTAAALLTLLTRKTVGFGVGYVDVSYKQLCEELGVHTRTLSRAAAMLEQYGDILRERVARRIYRWRIVLCRDEILEDPKRTYTTRAVCGADWEQQVRTKLSGPCRQSCPDHADTDVRTQSDRLERPNPETVKAETPLFEHSKAALKNSFKDTDLKKQHQRKVSDQSDQPIPKVQEWRADDEPLHKFCLRGLRAYGVSQRMARKLCRDHDHQLIRETLLNVPKLDGVKNVAGYLVAAIQDGGYPGISEMARAGDKKNAHQGSGGRSNYAHLTTDTVNRVRHENVKYRTSDAPVGYRTAEETRKEREALEKERECQERLYKDEVQSLSERFQTLSRDVKERLKAFAAARLQEIVPSGSQRQAEMLRDPVFVKTANRTALQEFLGWLDQGLTAEAAFLRMA